MYSQLLVLLFALLTAAVPIYDPYFVFCGSNQNCYDILQIRRNATSKQIRRAYRRLSLEFHPDKSKHANATEAFRLISKAYEVLDGNETRKNFDYYLDHPKDYFKVSGHHYMRQLPKSNVVIVLLLASALLSALLFWQQMQKYQSFIKRLKDMVMDCAHKGGQGNKQTMALYTKCVEMYEVKKKETAKEEAWASSSDSKKASNPKKLATEKVFEDCVDAVIAQVKIEGGYRKPVWPDDVFLVQMLYFPVHVINWAKTYHRRHLSGAELTLEEKLQMAKEALGPGTWENLSDAERVELVEKQIWNASVREEWLETRGKHLRMVVEDDEGGKIGPEEQQQQLNRKQRRMAEKKKDK